MEERHAIYLSPIWLKKWLKMCSTKKEQKEQIISSAFLDMACYLVHRVHI
jgi:hypothetical protein